MVTMSLVANAQLAAGGSAAMINLPDEGETMAAAGSAMYVNLGTMLPVYAETLPRTVRALKVNGHPWVLDPVGIGMGALRMELFRGFRELTPTIVRGNASEIIALANLWQLKTGLLQDGVRGVDATDSVQAAGPAAQALAKWIGGAVAVSGEQDLVTDGETTLLCQGGSELFTKITGAGCSLGGVTAVYAAVADPLVAALTAVQLYNYAGSQAEQLSRGPGSFEMVLRDTIYHAAAEAIAAQPFEQQEEQS
jgi:hydroxyethylthiazole kinase